MLALPAKFGLTAEVIPDGFSYTAANEPAGPNSPLAALYRAVATSDELIEYARKGIRG